VRIEDARLYLVIGAQPEIVESALSGGVDLVQLREKSLSDDELLEVARDFRRLCSKHGALFVVNDSPELAARVAADGVHVGQDDVSVAEARRIVGPRRLVGLSASSPDEIAAGQEADYLGVGPVFATPTKLDGAPAGLGLVAEAAQVAHVPWFAIGGIDASRLDDVLAAGATRVAVVRAIADAPDPAAAARDLRARLP
jgi:thiamine-phosphate pyrophosphorylase